MKFCLKLLTKYIFDMRAFSFWFQLVFEQFSSVWIYKDESKTHQRHICNGHLLKEILDVSSTLPFEIKTTQIFLVIYISTVGLELLNVEEYVIFIAIWHVQSTITFIRKVLVVETRYLRNQCQREEAFIWFLLNPIFTFLHIFVN